MFPQSGDISPDRPPYESLEGFAVGDVGRRHLRMGNDRVVPWRFDMRPVSFYRGTGEKRCQLARRVYGLYACFREPPAPRLVMSLQP
jgi:hypothetical protein